MVAPFPVLRLVVDRIVFEFHFTGAEIPLEVGHIVICVPEAPFDE